MTSDGSIVPYEANPGYSEITGGRKRRKSGKRRRSGKRSSRKSRKSRKYMKKMYRGGEKPDPPENEEEPEPEAEAEAEAEPVKGGRRKHKGKTRKGKVSKWITHVKNFSRANKMDFRDALKNPKCKAEYHKMK